MTAIPPDAEPPDAELTTADGSRWYWDGHQWLAAPSLLLPVSEPIGEAEMDAIRQQWERSRGGPVHVLTPPPRQVSYVGGLTYGGHIAWGIATLLTCGLAAPFWALHAVLGRRRIG